MREIIDLESLLSIVNLWRLPWPLSCAKVTPLPILASWIDVEIKNWLLLDLTIKHSLGRTVDPYPVEYSKALAASPTILESGR